jgi:hypothetical protein
MKAKQYAQHLFDKAVNPIMDLPLTDDTIKAIGLELAQVMLKEIMSANTKSSKHDYLCDVYAALMDGENIEY